MVIYLTILLFGKDSFKKHPFYPIKEILSIFLEKTGTKTENDYIRLKRHSTTLANIVTQTIALQTIENPATPRFFSLQKHHYLTVVI